MMSKKYLSSFLTLNPLFYLLFVFIFLSGNILETDILSNKKLSTDPTITYAQDLSSSYNERGYSKSNSVSPEGREIINDFNGNLMYEIPIVQGKGKGDLYYNFTLNYNGNINYNVITNNIQEMGYNFTKLNIYNISAPGWIFSINGMAVQMLNFETQFLTKPLSGNTAYGTEVRLLPCGYNVTNILTTPGANNKDKITVMLGDGSTETLENINGAVSTGDYKSISKGNYTRAKVIAGTGNIRRIMYLMKGDGLTYIYKEIISSYSDLVYNEGMPGWFEPKIFYLTEIADRFGNSYALDYAGIQGKNIGRLWLYSITGADIYFSYIQAWDQYAGIKVITSDGNYIFNTASFGIGVSDEHRPVLNYIINPTGEYMNFSYNGYERTATDLLDRFGNYELVISLGGNNTPKLKRLSKVINYDGGVKDYRYLSNNNISPISFMINENVTIHSTIENYKGYGRDLFFSNMLDTVITNDGANDIRKTIFEYDYKYPRAEYLIWQNPIDSADTCITTLITESLNNNYNYETPERTVTKKSYRIYKTRLIFSGETPDYNGTIKLKAEEYYSKNETTPFRTIGYEYYKGEGPNGYCSGSLLEKSVEENIEGIPRITQFEYEGGIDGPLSKKIETDPFGRLTEITYDSCYLENYQIFEESKFYSTSPPTSQQYDYIYFYLIHQPSVIQIKKGGNVLEKQQFLYYKPQSVTDPQNIVQGYPGQLQEIRFLDPGTSNTLRNKIYKYYNQDTTGKHMKPLSYFSIDEGNIKEITDWNGNKIKYYYHVISRSEEERYNCPPIDEENCPLRVSYHKLKDDGTEVIEKSNWQDSRLPTRIDGYYSENNFVTNYMLYNRIGNPGKIINSNRYFSEAAFQNYNRLGSITLPYDFSDASADTTITVVQHSTSVLLNSKMTYWGGRDEINQQYSFLSNDQITLTGVRIEHNYPIDDPDNMYSEKVNMLVKFDSIYFSTISEIDSAFLEFSPLYLQSTLEGTPTEDFNFYIKPLSQLYGTGSNMVYTEGNGILNIGYPDFAYSDYDCNISQNEFFTRYWSNFKKINITQLLQQNISGNSLQVKGMKFSVQYSGNQLSGLFNLKMFLYRCENFGFNNYYYNFSPVLKIYAKHNYTDTIISINYNSGTLRNIYDDLNNKVTTKSKIDKIGTTNRWKTTEYKFDNFGKLTETRLYTDENIYNANEINYNFLDLKSKLTDARNNITKISYNKYGSNSKTVNADESYTLDTIIFQNGLSYTFGTVSGLITKQVFTDEVGNNFDKYLDAAGNLKREIKYNESAQLITDYKYDDLYRVTEVRTPSDKRIYYEYDGLGRQSSRSTPDAGMVRYKYDRNDNIRFSQDRNQYNKPTETPPGKYITFRGYDGLNRLLYIGDTYTENYLMQWESLNPNPGQNYGFENYSLAPENFLVINVYDTLINYPANANIFTSPPQDYYSEKNNSKGNLCATAYRTLGTDGWNFKYYRYDARGRVKKMWNYINGLGWKVTEYEYNSQNQVTELQYQTANDNDHKVFSYEYDKAGRLKTSATDETRPPLPFTEYRYNQNSQIDSVFYNNGSYYINNYYNNRNWITQSSSSNNKLNFMLDYFANGNIGSQYINGNYKGNFSDTKEFRVNYVYDNSNRLTEVERFSTKYFDMSGIFTYDSDGNFLNLTRSYNGDSFGYEYYTGTNRLKKVTGESDQFTYDYNGNLTNDYFKNNTDIKYNHRNLITEITKYVGDIDPPATFITTYKYDEGGNRINKKVIKDDGSTMEIIVNEYYVRDVSGKEIAIYQNDTLKFWNIWGLGNEGRITSDGIRYYYIKDHLGSIRAVLNDSNNLVEAIDFDPWGHIARYWNSTASKYKFTGKERDNETGYDYFGARFYDSRIGNWTSTDPLFEKHLQWSPYNYVLRNPIIYFDPNGKQELVWELFKHTTKQTARTLLPWMGVPLSSIGSILSIFLSPTELGTKDVKQSIFEIDENGILISLYPIEEIIVTPSQSKSGKIQGIESNLVNIEEHLEKLGGVNPGDPDPHNNKNVWKTHIIKAIKESYKDFKQAYRRIKNKNFEEYLEKTFGKDRMQDIYDKLKDYDIDFHKIIK